MNKAQKQVQQVQLSGEQKTIKQLQRIYGQARKDCEQKIRELSSRTDLENLQSIIYQKQYQEALKKQLDGILDDLQGKEFSSITEYLAESYENGYIGVMYDLHKQGIPVIMPINQKQVVKALQTDSKLSKGLYSRLGEDVSYLKRSIRAELSRGIANGSTWNQIAGHIANGMNSPFNTAINNSIRIARTEGHRIQQRSALDAQYAAKEKGADVLKQWDSTLDNRTRPHHRQLDGQIRELDEDFEVDGLKAQAPGHFGKPKEDCNCRCCLLQRARWALDEEELQTLKDRAAYFGLDKTTDFEDFKKKYLYVLSNVVKDVTQEYLDMATPREGTITYDDGYNKSKHQNEIAVAKWIYRNLGGDVKLLSEANEVGIKTPDYEWLGKFWDLKTTTTAKSANSAVRHGLKQIQDNPGGIILDYGDNEVALNELANVLQKRLSASAQYSVDIMILRNGKKLTVFRYKK